MFDNDFKMFFGIIGFIFLMMIIITVIVVVNKKSMKQKFEDITNEEKREIRNIIKEVIQKGNYENIIYKKEFSNKSEMIQFKKDIIQINNAIVKESLIQCERHFKNKMETTKGYVHHILISIHEEFIDKFFQKTSRVPEITPTQEKSNYMLITNVKNYAIKNNYSLKSKNGLFSFIELFPKVLHYCDQNFSAANLYNYNNFDYFKIGLKNMLKITYKETYYSIFNHRENMFMLRQREMCENTFAN